MAQTKRSHVCHSSSCTVSCQGLPHNDILPHHQHPQQRNTGQIAHSAYAINATQAQNGNIFRFWHDAVLVFSRRSSPAAMLIHHSPPVGRAISVCRRKRRIAMCGQFSRSRAVRLLRRVTRTPGPATSVLHRAFSQSDNGRLDGIKSGFSDSQPAGHCDRVSPNPDNAHAVVLLNKSGFRRCTALVA